MAEFISRVPALAVRTRPASSAAPWPPTKMFVAPSSRVAALLTVMLETPRSVFETRSVPPVISAAPEKGLAAESVSVPPPLLVRPPEPETPPESVTDCGVTPSAALRVSKVLVDASTSGADVLQSARAPIVVPSRLIVPLAREMPLAPMLKRLTEIFAVVKLSLT